MDKNETLQIQIIEKDLRQAFYRISDLYSRTNNQKYLELSWILAKICDEVRDLPKEVK